MENKESIKNKKYKLLFICTSNLQRSPSAEELINNSEFNKIYEAKSAGLHPLAESVLTPKAIEWADYIFVMDEKHDQHKTILLEEFPEAKEKTIYVLEIPDIYQRNSPELIKLLKKKLKNFGF